MTFDECEGPIGTLVAVGGPGFRRAARDAEFAGWFAAAARRSDRVASVCSGAFLLAAAGLLDGRRAVTRNSRAELAERYPEVTVDPDPIFVRDGDVWTSARWPRGRIRRPPPSDARPRAAAPRTRASAGRPRSRWPPGADRAGSCRPAAPPPAPTDRTRRSAPPASPSCRCRCSARAAPSRSP
ncbi:hypothetical protein G3I60_18050 [Streptomyces sp. SID13666]|nr:hypothetical protein [Streptomyces sp. SID13666]